MDIAVALPGHSPFSEIAAPRKLALKLKIMIEFFACPVFLLGFNTQNVHWVGLQAFLLRHLVIVFYKYL